MEISEVSEEEQPRNFIAMVPERSKPLHNFLLPRLKWANQKLLRCMKVSSNGETFSADRRSSASEAESEGLINCGRERMLEKQRSLNGLESFKKPHSPQIVASARISKIEKDGGGGIETIEEQLVFVLQTATAIVDRREEDESLAAEARPWNLRIRSAASKAPNETGGSMNVEKKQNSSPMRIENHANKSLRLRGLAAAQGVEKKEPCKISIYLSREEIEKDFMLMAGTKPSRRPKKRAKIAQKQLDSIFPGMWLSGVTPDSYKAHDFP